MRCKTALGKCYIEPKLDSPDIFINVKLAFKLGSFVSSKVKMY